MVPVALTENGRCFHHSDWIFAVCGAFGPGIYPIFTRSSDIRAVGGQTASRAMTYTIDDVIAKMTTQELEQALDTALEESDNRVVWMLVDEIERRDGNRSL